MDVPSRIGGELGKLVLSYDPLVKATARRYQGRGAEFDDLVQEDYLALLMLIPKCQERKWLSYFLKSQLPARVRAAAAKLRQRKDDGGGEVELEAIEEIVSDPEALSEFDKDEVDDMLERALPNEEAELAKALMRGATQKDAARELGVTQQAVSARIRKIKEKLKPLFRRERPKDSNASGK